MAPPSPRRSPLARLSGIDLDVFAEALTRSAGNSRVIEYRGPLMLADEYNDPDTKTADLTVLIKDNNLIEQYAKDFNAPVPVFQASMFSAFAALAQGYGQEDPGVVTPRLRTDGRHPAQEGETQDRAAQEVMALTTGVIGLGNIGGGVAKNLATAGHTVIGYDIEPDRIAAAGAEPAADAADVADRADLIVLAVANLTAWRATLAAISAAGRRGLVVADLCTFPIAEKEGAHAELSRAGIDLLDCPVSGARPQAQAGELAMLVSGDTDAFARARPALESFCKSVLHVGDFGESAKIKYILNLIISIHNMACAEAFLLARKAGVDLQLMTDAVMESAAYSKIFEVRAEKWITGDYDDPTAELAIQLKDKDVIREFAAAHDCPTPMFDATMPYYIAAGSHGWKQKDAASILAVLEHMAGIPRD